MIHPSIIWACVGLILIVLEIFTASFFLLFFGVAALIVALLPLLGLHAIALELIAFGVLGTLGILVFRKKIKKSLETRSTLKTDQHKVVALTETILAGQAGKIVYRGVPWTAFNNSGFDLKAGDAAVIEKIEGVRLILNRSV